MRLVAVLTFGVVLFLGGTCSGFVVSAAVGEQAECVGPGSQLEERVRQYRAWCESHGGFWVTRYFDTDRALDAGCVGYEPPSAEDTTIAWRIR